MVVHEWTEGETRYQLSLDDGIYTLMFWSTTNQKWMWCRLEQKALRELHRVVKLLKEEI